LRLGCRRLAQSAGNFDEAVGGDADGGGGAGESDAMAARRAAVDEGVDVGEKAGGGVEEVRGVHGAEIVDEGEHFFEEGLVFFQRSAAAALQTVSGAEFLTAFRDAAAFAAVGKEVDAFLDHERFPPSKRKGSPRRAFLLVRGRYFSQYVQGSLSEKGRQEESEGGTVRR
jgi:hypothetical protein